MSAEQLLMDEVYAHCKTKQELAAANTQLANTQQLVRDLQQAIESKDARIAELEMRKTSLDHLGIDQPKRPILADQPEVFEALMDFIGTTFEVLGKISTHNDLVKSKANLRKLLVGE